VSTTFRKGDKIVIRHGGRDVPGWIELASENNVSLYIQWDYVKHEAMIAGCIGGMPLLLTGGQYHCLFNGELVEITRAQ
jgi:hypothetical protein